MPCPTRQKLQETDRSQWRVPINSLLTDQKEVQLRVLFLDRSIAPQTDWRGVREHKKWGRTLSCAAPFNIPACECLRL